MTAINWKGDGRKVIQPPADAMGIRPMAIRLGAARMVAQMFDVSGHSNHSAMGSTLWVVLDYCLTNGIAHSLTTYRCESGSVMGYEVKRLEPFYTVRSLK